MSIRFTNNELETRRKHMLSSGWIYAVPDTPGAYIPGPEMIQKWNSEPKGISNEMIIEIFKQYFDDPKLLEKITERD